MFGIDATQKLRQNRTLSRRVLSRNFRKNNSPKTTRHGAPSGADPLILKEFRKATRQTNRKDDWVALVIVFALLGMMIALFLYFIG